MQLLIILIFVAAQILFALLLRRRTSLHTLTTENITVDKLTVHHDTESLTRWLDEHYTPKRSTHEDMAVVYRALPPFMEETRQQLTDLRQELQDDGKLTRERIAQTKTRLADEEREDQANKRQARRKQGK